MENSILLYVICGEEQSVLWLLYTYSNIVPYGDFSFFIFNGLYIVAVFYFHAHEEFKFCYLFT